MIPTKRTPPPSPPTAPTRNRVAFSKPQSAAGHRVVLYGPGGIGKTTLASHCPGPVVVFDLDESLARLKLDNNPLVVEAWRGLATYGRAQRAYVGYLTVQAAVLVLWWPKSTMVLALASHHRPEPLLAVVIALGVTVAYHAMRTGAEVLRLTPAQ